MIILMKPDATAEQVQAVLSEITALGRKHHQTSLQASVMVSIEGETSPIALEYFKTLKGVERVSDLQVSLPKPISEQTPEP